MPYEKKNTDSVSIKEDRNSFLKHSDTNSYPSKPYLMDTHYFR